MPPLPPWEGLHPLVVHFPIVLLLAAPVLVALAALMRERGREFLLAATVTVGAGVLALQLAVSTGQAGEEHAESVPGAGAVLEQHEQLALRARAGFLWVFGGLAGLTALAWRRGRECRGWRRLVASAVVIGLYLWPCAILYSAAHQGARLVHEVGVRAPGFATGSAVAAVPVPDAPVPSSPPPPVAVAPPLPVALEPLGYPGLHNVVAFAPDVFSGSVPEGNEGFASLAGMGIRTILSVDGALPEVEAARAQGLRYVHLPITYSGITEERKLEIARAIRDLPRPLYVHCHHGKHRSAGAAGAALVALGWLTPDQAVERMKVSGTSPSYKGLYACAAEAKVAGNTVLDAVPAGFPERNQVTGLVRTMVEIDHAVERLAAAEKAGWQVPSEHPDLVPAAEAGHLADLLRALEEDDRVKAKPSDFLVSLRENGAAAQAVEDALVAGGDAARITALWKEVQQSCKSCHTRFRD